MRESLSNVARHARATAVEVQITVTDVLTVTVADDGVGFDPTARRGNGVRNLRERAEAHGGTATLEPGADGGTVVTWAVPLTG